GAGRPHDSAELWHRLRGRVPGPLSAARGEAQDRQRPIPAAGRGRTARAFPPGPDASVRRGAAHHPAERLARARGGDEEGAMTELPFHRDRRGSPTRWGDLTAVSTPLTLAELRAFDDVIDARSPAEYAEDHIPGALNAPVLDDEERALIGTIYKQHSA